MAFHLALAAGARAVSPPGEVSASPGDGQVALTWTSSPDAPTGRVMVRRGTQDFPQTPTSGAKVYAGEGTAVTDTGLKNGRRAYYSIFARGPAATWSTAATVSAVPHQGYPDTAFHDDGVAVYNVPEEGYQQNYGAAVATDSQGRIVVTGRTSVLLTNSDLNIWRLLPSGGLDPAFGSGGLSQPESAGVADDFGNAVLVDPSDRIVVAGASKDGDGNLAPVVWRVDSSGILDGAFAGSGRKGLTIAPAAGSRTELARAATLDPQGRIVVAGQTNPSEGNFGMALWRIKDDGTLDSTFNGVGYVVHTGAAGGSGLTSAQAVAIDRRERIVVAGYSTNADSVMNLTVWRYLKSGALDASFGTGGFLVAPSPLSPSDLSDAFAVAIDARGRILVLGRANGTSGYVTYLWKFLPDGSPDTAFGETGVVAFGAAPCCAGGVSGSGMTLDDEGRILVTGTFSMPDGNGAMAVARLRPTGHLDPAFGDAGYVLSSGKPAPYQNSAAGIAVDASGRIVVAGSTLNIPENNTDLAVWRFSMSGE